MAIPSTAFEQYTVAFYNVENLFDTTYVAPILQQANSIFGLNDWNANRYKKKLLKISEAISTIGFNQTGKLPSLIGLAEVANKNVLEDLITQPKLLKTPYDFIHYNSPDERGMDVALLYDTRIFTPTHHEAIAVLLKNENDQPDGTRDILYVAGILAGTPVHIYVNHWPSRRDGAEATAPKRMEAANQLMQHIHRVDPSGSRMDASLPTAQSNHIIILGDFNDDPNDVSIVKGLLPHGFINVTAPLKNNYRGSLNHHFKWNLFDQILISTSLQNDIPGTLYFHMANIFDDILLREQKGKYRGQPARTFIGRRYNGGYSDHFPVFAIFRKN